MQKDVETATLKVNAQFVFPLFQEENKISHSN
jgi:hypothetical protein